MPGQMRFGRRLPIPSTLQIRQELVRFGLEEEQRTRLSGIYGLPAHASWHEIGAAQQRVASGAQGSLAEARANLDEHERVLDTFSEANASPAKGMARLRQGLSENNVRSLENSQPPPQAK